MTNGLNTYINKLKTTSLFSIWEKETKKTIDRYWLFSGLVIYFHFSFSSSSSSSAFFLNAKFHDDNQFLFLNAVILLLFFIREKRKRKNKKNIIIMDIQNEIFSFFSFLLKEMVVWKLFRKKKISLNHVCLIIETRLMLI